VNLPRLGRVAARSLPLPAPSGAPGGLALVVGVVGSGEPGGYRAVRGPHGADACWGWCSARGVADRRVPVVPLVFVMALGVVLRVLGFGYLLAGRRGPVLLVALLVVTTLLAWTPWAAVTAVGAALAVAGGFRLPRRQLLALGMLLGAGAGWVKP
jgi:hypothetical protein